MVADALVKLLKFNSAGPNLQAAGSANEEAFKVLVLDKQTKDIIAPLLKVSDLRKYGVTLHLMITTERQSIPDVPAIYFVDATEDNIRLIVAVRPCADMTELPADASSCASPLTCSAGCSQRPVRHLSPQLPVQHSPTPAGPAGIRYQPCFSLGDAAHRACL